MESVVFIVESICVAPSHTACARSLTRSHALWETSASSVQLMDGRVNVKSASEAGRSNLHDHMHYVRI